MTGQADANGDHVIDSGTGTRDNSGWFLIGRENVGGTNSTTTHDPIDNVTSSYVTNAEHNWSEHRGQLTSGNGHGSQGYNTNPDPNVVVATNGDATDNGGQDTWIVLAADANRTTESYSAGPNPSHGIYKSGGASVHISNVGNTSKGNENHDDTRQGNNKSHTDHRDGTLGTGESIFGFGSQFYSYYNSDPKTGVTETSTYLRAGSSLTTGGATSTPNLDSTISDSTGAPYLETARGDETGTNQYTGNEKTDNKVLYRITQKRDWDDPNGPNSSTLESTFEITNTYTPHVATEYTETSLVGPGTSQTAGDELPHADTGQTIGYDQKHDWTFTTAGAGKSGKHEFHQLRTGTQSDGGDYHYDNDGTPVDGKSPHKVFTFDVSWTRGRGDTTFTKDGGWTDRPYGIWPGLVFNGNVILKDTDRDFTLNSNWYDYDEESQYNSDGTKNGEYDKSLGDHHEDTASHDRALEKVLEYFDQGVYPNGYHRNSANNSDTPNQETGKHDHDIGHINGHSTVDYGPRPGETGYTPSTEWINQPGVSANDVLRDLTASYPPRDLPRVIDQVAEGPESPGFFERILQWFGIRSKVDAAQGAAQLDENIDHNKGVRSRLADKVKFSSAPIEQATNGQDAEWNALINELRNVTTPETQALLAGLAEATISINAASAGMASASGAAVRTGPANSKGIAKPQPVPGVGIDDHHSIVKFLGGDAKQIYAKLPRTIHQEFHRNLRERLLRNGFPFDASNTPTKAWVDYFRKNPGEQGRALRMMAESSAEIDAKYGTDILSKVYGNLRRENLTEY